ncbi:CaiB/BaiF CoA transferase family protein [Alicyclobacillus ferrooxydans]|uniref:CaiB/BaiF CoA transferase family protein n=1 Tax=Alicyclobacillus ferrooxydans TaxID=471514 RepID=UPI0024800A67|nr:CoA transferase [Alicyclobacillus ferrooxydans]
MVIVDLTRILSGPYCTMYFADMGANVIKVEPPGGDDTRTWGPPFINGESSYFLSVNRNKRSIVLDLKSEEGKTALRGLIEKADVVVENFKPGTLDRLGFSFAELQKIKSDIILASISGFGQTGPYRTTPGYDLIAQGMSGFMSVTGDPGGHPLKGGYSLADVGTGMWAIIGILTALHQRALTGKGQWVDVSLLETMLSWQTYQAGNFFATGNNPRPLGNMHPNICPYQSFPAMDGHFNLAVGNDKLWAKCCDVIGRAELTNDPRFATNPDRVSNRDELIPILESEFSKHTVREWVVRFTEANIPCGPINRFSDIYADPAIQERQMVIEAEHPRADVIQMVATPIKYHGVSDDDESVSPPPLLGEHSEEILHEFQLDATALTKSVKIHTAD